MKIILTIPSSWKRMGFFWVYPSQSSRNERHSVLLKTWEGSTFLCRACQLLVPELSIVWPTWVHSYLLPFYVLFTLCFLRCFPWFSETNSFCFCLPRCRVTGIHHQPHVHTRVTSTPSAAYVVRFWEWKGCRNEKVMLHSTKCSIAQSHLKSTRRCSAPPGLHSRALPVSHLGFLRLP